MPKPLAKWNSARDVWEAMGGTGSLFCEHSDVYSETFTTSGMTRNGVAYELPTWEHHTGASESSSSQPDEGRNLPTPTTRDWKDNVIRLEPHRPNDVDTLARALTILLPTPTASEGTGAGNGPNKTGGENLRTAVALLPTPNTMDMLPAREGEAMERQLRRGQGENASRRTTMGNLREDILQTVNPDYFK